MPNPYSNDLRWRVIWLYLAKNLSIAEVSELVCVSERTIKRYITQFNQTGDVHPATHQHGPPKLLGEFEQLVLLRLITENTGIYLYEIQTKLVARFGSNHLQNIEVYGVL